MALQAHAVHVATLQQARIRRTVREMAGGAALSLNWGMLVDERSGGLDVTLRANGILGRTNAEQCRLEGTVWVVAVRALD